MKTRSACARPSISWVIPAHNEPADFAQRMKKHGRLSNRKWGTLIQAPLTTSCRKFDQFGDGFFVKNPGFVQKAFRGTDPTFANRFWYDVRSDDETLQ